MNSAAETWRDWATGPVGVPHARTRPGAKMRGGQVALFLVAILVALTVMLIMNVNVFLAVRTKNRTMNAGDAAALAAAGVQARLLNQIGRLNVEHLEAAIDGDVKKCAEIMEEQSRLCFLGPLAALEESNRAARENGAQAPDDEMTKILRQHVIDIRMAFQTNPDLYPEPWSGAWEEYAEQLETQIGTLGGGVVAGPDNVEFASAYSCFPLLNKQFYNAIAGRNWCWFHFNGEWLLDCDHEGMPEPSSAPPQSCANSEIYSLHLRFAPLVDEGKDGLDEEWLEIIRKLTGRTISRQHIPALLEDPTQLWAFFDSRWAPWSTYPGIEFNPSAFPIVGSVKSEYDVYGAAALCRVRAKILAVAAEGAEGSGDGGTLHWTAGAKPFGTVSNLEGENDVVTSLREFVTEAFTDVKLVPIDAVGGRSLATADYNWLEHVRKHIPGYLASGGTGGGCWYCQQLRLWENEEFRRAGKIWLRFNGKTCRRCSGGGGGGTGGTAHGH